MSKDRIPAVEPPLGFHEITRRAPERVTRLALVNAGGRPGSDEQLAAWQQLHERVEEGEFAQVVGEISVANLPEQRRTDTALIARLAQMARDVGRLGLLRQLDAQRTRPDSRRFLDRITCTTLVVSGSEDHVCPPALQRELVDGLPAARLATIEGSGHMAPLEAHRELAALLGEWLD